MHSCCISIAESFKISVQIRCNFFVPLFILTLQRRRRKTEPLSTFYAMVCHTVATQFVQFARFSAWHNRWCYYCYSTFIESLSHCKWNICIYKYIGHFGDNKKKSKWVRNRKKTTHREKTSETLAHTHIYCHALMSERYLFSLFTFRLTLLCFSVHRLFGVPIRLTLNGFRSAFVRDGTTHTHTTRADTRNKWLGVGYSNTVHIIALRSETAVSTDWIHVSKLTFIH